MKLIIDTKEKSITIEESVVLDDLLNELTNMFGSEYRGYILKFKAPDVAFELDGSLRDGITFFDPEINHSGHRIKYDTATTSKLP